MEKRRWFEADFIFFVFIVSIVLISGCIGYVSHTGEPQQKENKTGAEKIGVVVSILPQKEFVEKVGGDKVKVTVMIPPGANPHTYEPTPSQLTDVGKAKIYAKIGSGIEFEISWMDKLISMNQNMFVVDCSKGINLVESEDEDEPGMDPHIWTSIKNAKIMVKNIRDGLIEIDPENKNYYDENAEKYIKELDKLDEEVAQYTSETKNKDFIVFHPAFAYFCRDYGLHQIPVEQEGKEPTAKWMERVIEEAKQKNIKVIFVSPQFNQKSAEVIANEIQGKVVSVDPLAEDYLENMRKIAKAFTTEA